MWYSICYKGYPNLPDDAASATDWPEATCDGGAGVKFEQIPLFYPRGCAAHEDLHLEPEQLSKLRTCHNRDLQVARSLDDSLLSPSFPDAFWLEGLRPPGPPRLPYPAPDIEVRDSESSDRDYVCNFKQKPRISLEVLHVARVFRFLMPWWSHWQAASKHLISE